MLDTKLVAVVSTKDVTINGKIIKAGYMLGYIRASSQADAKKVLATAKTVTLVKIIIEFEGYPKVVSEYGLKFVAELPTKDLLATSNLAVTKLGARMITVNEKLSIPNFANKFPIFEQPTNAKVVGSISAMNLTASQRYFTTGYVYYGANGGLWHNITNADKSENGWILYDTRYFTYASTWSDFTKEVTNVVVQQPLQAVRDTVESVQKNSNTFLGLLAVIATVLIFKK